MVAVHVLRVFTDPEGRWGNPLAVFLDGAAITEQMRLAVAEELGTARPCLLMMSTEPKSASSAPSRNFRSQDIHLWEQPGSSP